MGRYPIALVSIAALASGLAAARASEGQRFAGTWEARYKGTLICTIKVEAGDKITGALYGCSINVNNDGDLLDSEIPIKPDEASPIRNFSVREKTLSFEVNDGGDAMKFALVITGEGQAELQFLEAPVKIKPIRFERK